MIEYNLTIATSMLCAGGEQKVACKVKVIGCSFEICYKNCQARAERRLLTNYDDTKFNWSPIFFPQIFF